MNFGGPNSTRHQVINVEPCLLKHRFVFIRFLTETKVNRHLGKHMMYSIKNSFVDIASSILPVPSNTHTRRGHSQMLYIPHARTLTYQRSFIPDAARLWNSVPDRIINCISPLNFKDDVQHLQAPAPLEDKSVFLAALIFNWHCTWIGPHKFVYPARCTWLHCTPYQFVDTPHGGLYFTERRRSNVS